MILKMEKKRQTDEAYIKDLLKSTGYLFPETDEQMSIYEANVTLRELPEKFRTPEFVFNAVQNQRSSKHCTDMDNPRRTYHQYMQHERFWKSKISKIALFG